MNDERIDNYLGEMYPPSFDEWNARRLHMGMAAGDFEEYLQDIGKTPGPHTGQTGRLYLRGLCTAEEWLAVRAKLLNEVTK